MTRNRLALVAIVLIALMPIVALAGPGSGPRGDRGGPGAGRHFLPPPGYLDLTEEQAEAAEAIRDNVREQLDAQRQQHHAARQQLRDLLASDSPDPVAVGQLVIEMHGQRDPLRSVLEAAEAEFEALLTDEQLEKWENFKELRQSRRHRGPGRHGSRGDGGPGFGGPGFGDPPDGE